MTTGDETTLYCANHPNVETTLRCNRCEKPICARCAVLTPTGYRCKECVRGQQKTFNTALWYDYVVGIVIAAVLSYLGSLIVPRLGFFTLFVAPVAGVIIAEAVRAVTRRHRSRRLFQVVAAATFVGSLPYLLMILLGLVVGGLVGQFDAGFLLTLVWYGLYTFTVTSTVYYRLGGITIR